MNIAKEYFSGLKKAYLDAGKEEEWKNFESVVHGASEEDLKKLCSFYPDAPESLLELLKIVDGTYWREYKGEKVAFYLLGSDLTEYPYYLLSAKEMCENDAKWLADYVNREYDEVRVDERIIDKADRMHWLHFSDCMNNGGTSQLFIDFSPSPKGVGGQIVRYLHDPDELKVIADSFHEYLKKLMEHEFDFVDEDL